MNMPHDLARATFRGKPCDLDAVTGLLMDTSSTSETKVSGVIPGSRHSLVSGRISSKTTRYTKMFLQDENRREHAFEMVDFDVPVRKGNVVTVVKATREGKRDGSHIALFNHDAGDVTYNLKRLQQLNAPTLVRWVMLGMAALLLVAMMRNDGVGGFLAAAGMVPAYFVAKAVKNRIGMSRARRYAEGPQARRMQEVFGEIALEPYRLAREERG